MFYWANFYFPMWKSPTRKNIIPFSIKNCLVLPQIKYLRFVSLENGKHMLGVDKKELNRQPTLTLTVDINFTKFCWHLLSRYYRQHVYCKLDSRNLGALFLSINLLTILEFEPIPGSFRCQLKITTCLISKFGVKTYNYFRALHV